MTKFDHIDRDLRICAFCMTTTYAYICPDCGDYKGLMEISSRTEEYLGVDLLDYV